MKPFFMIAHQRSGTTALRATLLMHDQIGDCGEAFNVEGHRYLENYFHFLRLDNNRALLSLGNSTLRFLKYYEYLCEVTTKPLGLIDAKYDSLRLFDPESHELGAAPALFKLINEVNGSVVHLTRNPFHIYVSHQFAVSTGVFHVDHAGASPRDVTLTIDVADLLFYVERRVRERQLVSEYVRECFSAATFDYSEIFLHDGLYLAPLCAHLGVSHESMSPPLRKSITTPYAQLISNYEAVIRSLSDNGYGDLLTDSEI